jgi:hypothetical protein
MNWQTILESLKTGASAETFLKLMLPGVKERIVKEVTEEVFGQADLVHLAKPQFESKIRTKIDGYAEYILNFVKKEKKK